MHQTLQKNDFVKLQSVDYRTGPITVPNLPSLAEGHDDDDDNDDNIRVQPVSIAVLKDSMMKKIQKNLAKAERHHNQQNNQSVPLGSSSNNNNQNDNSEGNVGNPITESVPRYARQSIRQAADDSNNKHQPTLMLKDARSATIANRKAQ